MMEASMITFLLIAVVVIIVLSVFFSFFPVMLWVSAWASGVKISIITLVAMRLRRVTPSRIVNPLIKATKAGLGLNINQLESHYLAGGNVDRVVNALIAAQRADIPLEFTRAAAIDLAGRDVLLAVQMSVNPRVIETPIVAAVAKNGIEVKVKARVTVRANIDRLVGGAGEETIIARVGEGIVTTVYPQPLIKEEMFYTQDIVESSYYNYKLTTSASISETDNYDINFVGQITCNEKEEEVAPATPKEILYSAIINNIESVPSELQQFAKTMSKHRSLSKTSKEMGHSKSKSWTMLNSLRECLLSRNICNQEMLSAAGMKK